MTELEKYVGKHVQWEKLEGKPDAYMYEKEGFGTFYCLELGERMIISGDYGIYTSAVQSFTVTKEGITVKTRNSVYFVKSWLDEC